MKNHQKADENVKKEIKEHNLRKKEDEKLYRKKKKKNWSIKKEIK